MQREKCLQLELCGNFLVLQFRFNFEPGSRKYPPVLCPRLYAERYNSVIALFDYART